MLSFPPFTSESTLKYQFNTHRSLYVIPLPFGGKSSKELRIPAVVSSPHISLPQVGLELPSREVRIPTFTIPYDYDLTLPNLGKAEMSAKVKSNYYNMEATVSAGSNLAERPDYLASFNIMADSPVEVLSFSTEGNLIFIL